MANCRQIRILYTLRLSGRSPGNCIPTPWPMDYRRDRRDIRGDAASAEEPRPGANLRSSRG
jgi:hypothetical protein